MKRPATLLRRVLTVLLAVTPLLASADLCTLGALTGRAGLGCGMESGAPGCRVAPETAPKCPHCAPTTPVREVPRSHGPTCCDLRPQAADVAGQPVLTAPSALQSPVVARAAAAPVVLTVSVACVTPDDGRAPPGDVPVLRSPRAPPLG
jgi:hypothetical protein